MALTIDRMSKCAFVQTCFCLDDITDNKDEILYASVLGIVTKSLVQLEIVFKSCPKSAFVIPAICAGEIIRPVHLNLAIEDPKDWGIRLAESPLSQFSRDQEVTLENFLTEGQVVAAHFYQFPRVTQVDERHIFESDRNKFTDKEQWMILMIHQAFVRHFPNILSWTRNGVCVSQGVDPQTYNAEQQEAEKNEKKGAPQVDDDLTLDDD